MSEQISAFGSVEESSAEHRTKVFFQNNHSRDVVHNNSEGKSVPAAPSQNTKTSQLDERDISYRVRRIPSKIDSQSFSNIIAEMFKLKLSGFEIHSLATDISNEKNDSYRTATVSFQQTPSLLKDRKDELGRDGVLLPYAHIYLQYPKPLVFDTHFSRFTPLSSWENDQKHTITCIVIHGWGGHAIGSFKSAVDSHVWPRDSLPNHSPELRVWTYGYGSKLTDLKSHDDPYIYAAEFRDHFRRIQKRTNAMEHPKPIIFIVHSLGGWVLKQTLARMHVSSDPIDRKSLQSIYGALFFGVPGQGMDVTALATMLEGTPHEYTVDLLNQKLGFQLRNEEQEDFSRAFGYEDSEIVHFFEQRKSKTVIEDPQTGKYKRDGPQVLLVTEISATYGHHWKNGSGCIHSLGRDHFNLVKFSEYESDYGIVADVIQSFSDKAVDVIMKRTQCHIGTVESHSSKQDQQDNVPKTKTLYKASR